MLLEFEQNSTSQNWSPIRTWQYQATKNCGEFSGCLKANIPWFITSFTINYWVHVQPKIWDLGSRTEFFTFNQCLGFSVKISKFPSMGQYYKSG